MLGCRLAHPRTDDRPPWYLWSLCWLAVETAHQTSVDGAIRSGWPRPVTLPRRCAWAGVVEASMHNAVVRGVRDDEEREFAMVAPSRQTDPSLQDVPRGMLAAAAVLIGLASLIGLAGVATVAVALATTCRRWYSRADLSPADLARLKWEQAKAAAGAGGGAWRETELAKYSPRSASATR